MTINKWRKKFDALALKHGDSIKANDYQDENVYWEVQKVVNNLINGHNSQKLIDIGCGNGLFLDSIITHKIGYGIDISFNML